MLVVVQKPLQRADLRPPATTRARRHHWGAPSDSAAAPSHFRRVCGVHLEVRADDALRLGEAGLGHGIAADTLPGADASGGQGGLRRQDRSARCAARSRGIPHRAAGVREGAARSGRDRVERARLQGDRLHLHRDDCADLRGGGASAVRGRHAPDVPAAGSPHWNGVAALHRVSGGQRILSARTAAFRRLGLVGDQPARRGGLGVLRFGQRYNSLFETQVRLQWTASAGTSRMYLDRPQAVAWLRRVDWWSSARPR